MVSFRYWLSAGAKCLAHALASPRAHASSNEGTRRSIDAGSGVLSLLGICDIFVRGWDITLRTDAPRRLNKEPRESGDESQRPTQQKRRCPGVMPREPGN